MKKLLFLTFSVLLLAGCGSTEVCDTNNEDHQVVFNIGILSDPFDCPNNIDFVTGPTDMYSKTESRKGKRFLRLDFTYGCLGGCPITNTFFREDLQELSPSPFSTAFQKNNFNGAIRLDPSGLMFLSGVYHNDCHNTGSVNTCSTCENPDGTTPNFINTYSADEAAGSIIFSGPMIPGGTLPRIDVLIVFVFADVICCETA